MKMKTRKDYEMEKLYFDKNNCPFCVKLNKKEIIFETEFWIVLQNKYPYFDDKIGLLAVPKRHIEFSCELTKEESADFVEIEKFMKKYFEKLGDYFSFIRQSKSNKSVEHMHHHYLLGKLSAKIIDGERYFKLK